MSLPPSRIVGKYLTNAGVFSATLSADWALFISSLPNEPFRAAAIFDTAAVKDGRYALDGTNIIHPGIQLRVRSNDYELGWAKIKEAETSLSTIKNTNVVVDSTTYILYNVSLTTPAFQIGPQDGSSRNMEWTSNFILTVATV